MFLFEIGILFVFIVHATCSNKADIVLSYCSQTESESMFPTPRTIIPEPINSTTSFQPSLMNRHMKLELCPNSRFLKLSWNTSGMSGNTTTLCLMITDDHNNIIMDSVCYKLKMHPSNYSLAMNCWFPLEQVTNDQVITAWTLPGNGSTLIFHGRLTTSALDLRNPCDDICEVVAMTIESQINCIEKSSIKFDKSIEVENISFDTSEAQVCKNGISTLNRLDDHLDYMLNCSFDGTGHIKVLYKTNGKYCLKYQVVKVHCPKTSDDSHAFGTFVIFGTVCVAVIATVFFAVVLTAQRIHDNYNSQHGKHHPDVHKRRFSDFQHSRYDSGLLHPGGSKRGECFQLSQFRPQPSGSKQTDALISTEALQTKEMSRRPRSASTSSDKIPEEENEKRRLIVTQIRRSITMPFLEDSNAFYKKRILFLPIPFDHFTNDVVKILKSVFMDEGGIISECCFDRKVYQNYMETERFKWIEHLFSEHDKILIFLCFTSLSLDPPAKKESVAEVVLENLLFTKVKSHRFCKVFLLHLTDRPDSIQSHDIGENFHISGLNSYDNFIRNVFDSCGRNPDDNLDMIERIVNCKASKHFLRFIGIKHEFVSRLRRQASSLEVSFSN